MRTSRAHILKALVQRGFAVRGCPGRFRKWAVSALFSGVRVPLCASQAFHRLTGNDGAGNAFSWSFGQRFGQQQTKLEALVFEPRKPLES